MTAPIDFLRLYQELGLAPGASFDDLKRAYRRRVAELHPDRAGVVYSATVPGAAERLQHITLLYNAATQFHRQHGRLPGATNPPRPHTPHPVGSLTPAPPSRTRRKSRVPWLLALATLLLLVWIVWGQWPETPPGDGDAPASFEPPRPAPSPASVVDEPTEPAPVPVLKLGLTEDRVLELEGEPVTRGADRWDYGPSWVAFRQHKVSDWYSSPLRPLKRATKRPPAEHAEPTS